MMKEIRISPAKSARRKKRLNCRMPAAHRRQVSGRRRFVSSFQNSPLKGSVTRRIGVISSPQQVSFLMVRAWSVSNMSLRQVGRRVLWIGITLRGTSDSTHRLLATAPHLVYDEFKAAREVGTGGAAVRARRISSSRRHALGGAGVCRWPNQLSEEQRRLRKMDALQ